MRLQTILNILASYEKETIRVELKESSKFLTGEGKFDGKELASIIVSFANRDGGMLIVGVKDNGMFEGSSVFDKFSSSGKNGFDKFKEYVENICKDVISPQIFVESNLFVYEGNEFGVISVPKRLSIPHALVSKHEGSVAKSREYYVRTTHGKGLVSDRHLEWMFSHTDLPVIKSEHIIEITMLRDSMKVPETLGAFERFSSQPYAYRSINEYIELINSEKLELFKKSYDKREQLLREILIYSVIQSTEYISDHNKALPLPNEKMIMQNAIGDIVKRLIHKKGRLWSVPYGTSMKIRSGAEFAILKFGNKHMLGTLIVHTEDRNNGLSELNPYAHIVRQHQEFETITFKLKYQVKLKYPEDFDDTYERMIEFSEALQQTLNEKWDIITHLNSMPHYKLLYEINHKLDLVLEKDKD